MKLNVYGNRKKILLFPWQGLNILELAMDQKLQVASVRPLSTWDSEVGMPAEGNPIIPRKEWMCREGRKMTTEIAGTATMVTMTKSLLRMN